MSEDLNFTASLKTAISEKTTWFNTEELPHLLDQYRLLHTCVKNIFDALVKKSLITPDPYKAEKKISEISAPDDAPFIENERSMVIGSRFSDYESMLDFMVTYVKYSVENISLPKIRKFIEVNNAFQWNNMTLNNSRVNTRGLATLINEARKNSPQITLSLINDSITKSGSCIVEIARILKELADFKKEEYKYQVRTQVMDNPGFNREKALSSEDSELSEIKRLFPQTMGKQPFYSDLIQEIVAEDLSPNKELIQKNTLSHLAVKKDNSQQKKNTVDTKALVLGAMHILATIAPTYIDILEKLSNNVQVLKGRKKSLGDKIKEFFRKLANRPDPTIVYNFVITDQKKNTKIVKAVDITVFMSNIEKKANFFGILINKNSPEFKKLSSFPEKDILEYLNKQLSENQEIMTLLEAADEYFKMNVVSVDRGKIKGLKMDLMSLKNVIVKSISKRTEYVSYVEEQEQMRKLGITNEV